MCLTFNTELGSGIASSWFELTTQDLFIQTISGEDIKVPPPRSGVKLSKSQCTPLFMNAYRIRNARAVIHTHSKYANLITLLTKGSEFRISHQEMIKGVRNQVTKKAKRFDDTLIVPIIPNTCEEKDLEDSMAECMLQYPETCAVLVRQHGVYVWGDTWQQAKSICECYDYLFEIGCDMVKYGIPLVKETNEGVANA